MYPFKIVTIFTWGSTGDMISIAISLLVSELVKLVSKVIPQHFTYIYMRTVLYILSEDILGTQFATTVE